MTNRPEGGRVWSVVKFDLPDQRIVEEFNLWYSEMHAPRVIERDGFFGFWRTGESREAPNVGTVDTEFWAIYEMDAIERFAPQPGRASFDANEPARVLDRVMFKVLTNWSRPFFHESVYLEHDDATGILFAREEFDIDESALDEVDEVCRTDYLPRMLELPGIHRAWQLHWSPTELQVGPDPVARHLQVFEIDTPDALLATGRPQLADEMKRADRSPVRFTGRHFADLLAHATRP